MNKTRIIACTAIILSACATPKQIPEFPKEIETNILQVQQAIQCEISQAYKETGGDRGWLKGKIYSARLEIETTKDKSINPTIGLENGVGSVVGQLFEVGVDITAEDETFREGQVNFTGSFAGTFCVEPKSEYGQLFEGKVGITEWLGKITSTAQHLEDLKKTKKSTVKLGQLDYILSFTYEATGSISPAFTLISTGVDSLSPAVTLATSKERVYLLSMTIQDPPPTPKRRITELDKKAVTEIENAIRRAIAANNKLSENNVKLAEINQQISVLEGPREEIRQLTESEKEAEEEELRKLKLQRDNIKKENQELRNIPGNKAPTITKNRNSITDAARRSVSNANRSVLSENNLENLD